MSWEQAISQLLQDLEEAAVRFDIEQDLNSTEKQTARTNISFGATATQITGDDYKIVMT